MELIEFLELDFLCIADPVKAEIYCIWPLGGEGSGLLGLMFGYGCIFMRFV
jgi:hypothetical protein